MLLINFIRSLFILAAIGLYHIYNKDFLTVDQGVVVWGVSFFGLTLWEIVEDYVIEQFNQESPKTRV